MIVVAAVRVVVVVVVHVVVAHIVAVVVAVACQRALHRRFSDVRTQFLAFVLLWLFCSLPQPLSPHPLRSRTLALSLLLYLCLSLLLPCAPVNSI